MEVATGVTGDLVTVSCAQGYTGPLELDNNQTGGIVECQASGTFTSFNCTPNACENLIVPLSSSYGVGTDGVSGVTGDVVTVECTEPFASGTSCCHYSLKENLLEYKHSTLEYQHQNTNREL